MQNPNVEIIKYLKINIDKSRTLNLKSEHLVCKKYVDTQGLYN